jgi:hypothetical protein
VHHGDESFRKFFPTHEYSTKAIHPIVSTFDYPATRLESGLLPDCLGFFASGMDVSGKAELPGNVADFVKVVLVPFNYFK